MNTAFTDTLCTECGLCCDGSLFSEVELKNSKESSGLEFLGLTVEDGDEDEPALLMQPCRALKGTRCSIYPHRPRCCRTFECRLLQEVQRGTIPLAQAKQIIAETRQRIDHLAGLIRSNRGSKGSQGLPLKEQYYEALERCGSRAASPVLPDYAAELQRSMLAVESILAKHFL